MKKKLLVSLLLVLLSTSLCSYADEWDDISDVDRIWDGQKSITNKEFDQVIDVLETNKKQKEEKQRKKKIKKISGGGNSLHSELNPDKEIKEVPDLKNKSEEGILVNIPVNLVLGDCILEKGFYKVFAERDEHKKIFLSFYQSQFFKGKIEAIETEDDFEEEDLDFARVIPYNKSFIRMIFGSLDFNAYVYIPYLSD